MVIIVFNFNFEGTSIG